MTSLSSRPRVRRRSKVLNKQRRLLCRPDHLADFADAVLNYLGASDQEVVIMLVNDSIITKYNARFLGHDRPTDVIAFPYADSRKSRDRFEPNSYLGDILISADTAAANARRYRLTPAREIKNLIIHGIIHLLGYDHTTDHGQMRRLERRARRALL
ncbi:MAG: rRNA maturation RNase YbeY [Acidobacteria bacterium]|nr:rRNA maturation RNase YbeY [Acidobacteriota bacterium]MBI3655322.1 rRNA maturation RNase YbeY [Acidobacteriota bacterium]